MATTLIILTIILAITAYVVVAIRKAQRKIDNQMLKQQAIDELKNFTDAYSQNRNLGGKSLQYPPTVGVAMPKKEDPKKSKNTKSTKRSSGSSSGNYDYGVTDYGYSSGSYDSGSSSSSSDSGSSGGGCD